MLVALLAAESLPPESELSELRSALGAAGVGEAGACLEYLLHLRKNKLVGEHGSTSAGRRVGGRKEKRIQGEGRSPEKGRGGRGQGRRGHAWSTCCTSGIISWWGNMGAPVQVGWAGFQGGGGRFKGRGGGAGGRDESAGQGEEEEES